MVHVWRCTKFRFVVICCAIATLAVFYKVRKANMPCIFCKIINKETETVLVYEDEDFVAFNDIKPAAKFHYLIIPKKHIPDVKSLTVADKTMLENMKRIMLDILKEQNQTDVTQISLGFHIPPFNSIKHLHLHGISPKSDMGMVSRWVFREDTMWYKTIDSVISNLPESL